MDLLHRSIKRAEPPPLFNLASILAVLAALTLCAVSIAMNVLFLSGFGQSDIEAVVLGAASGAADILKCLLPLLIAYSWREKRTTASASGLFVWALFTAISFTSAIGFAADNRAYVTASRAGIIDAQTARANERLSLQARLSALPPHRPVAVVEAAIQAHQQSQRWIATHKCENATISKSRDYCAGFFKLEAERSAAKEADALRGELRDLPQEGGGYGTNDRSADPQVSLLAKISGLAEDRVQLILIVAVALLVELGSSIGLFLASSVATEPQPASTDELDNVQANFGCVEEFCLQKLERAPDQTAPLSKVLSAYRNWCQANELQPLSDADFRGRFAALTDHLPLHLKGNAVHGIGVLGD